MPTPSLPSVVLRRQITSENQTVEERVAPATYAEYVAIKQRNGSATETLVSHLASMHNCIDDLSDHVSKTSEAIEDVKQRFGKITKMSYGTENPPSDATVGEIYFKLKGEGEDEDVQS